MKWLDIFCNINSYERITKMIALYLSAIVLANLSVAFFGTQMAVINSFLFIGLDLTSRDILHDRWRGRGLFWKMALLIASGSILSYILNRNAGPIAIASFVAFIVAGLVDTVTYTLLEKRGYMTRVNGSNVTTSIIDSVAFVALAFGSPMLWGIAGLSIVSKLAGGFAWSLALRKWRK
jgi:hypothetical protein